jgi:hypothetical protein
MMEQECVEQAEDGHQRSRRSSARETIIIDLQKVRSVFIQAIVGLVRQG